MIAQTLEGELTMQSRRCAPVRFDPDMVGGSRSGSMVSRGGCVLREIPNVPSVSEPR